MSADDLTDSSEDPSKNGSVACPVTAALELIGAKWKVLIVHHLFSGTKRFGELQKLLPGITQKMLAMRLRELEKDQMVERKVYPVVPPKVEYTLTEKGESLELLIEQVRNWGADIVAPKISKKLKKPKELIKKNKNKKT